MDDRIFELMQAKKEQNELALLDSYNEKTQRFGLSLSADAAKELIVCRNSSLKKHHRVEFGAGILDKLIFAFCDSQYLNQDDYLETLKQLQDIFYEFKNETGDKLTDDELMTFMKEQFETVCTGDTEYLESTCLERFAAAVRAGYDGYRKSGGAHEYERFDEEQRWDKNLYQEALRDLFWR